MKKIFIVLLLLSFIVLNAQKIKDKNLVFYYYQYPMKPTFTGSPVYSYYVTEMADEFNTNKSITYSSVGAPMNLKSPSPIKDLNKKNTSVAWRPDSKYSGAMSGFLNGLKTGIGDSGELRLCITISPFVLQKRQPLYSSQQNQQNMGYAMTYSYDQEFSMSAGATFKTKDGRIIYHDTINPKTPFQSNYPVTIPLTLCNGNGLTQGPGWATQIELENNFLNQRSLYLSSMKSYYTDQLLTSIKNTLNDFYTFSYTHKVFRFYTIKSKKQNYAELDSALTIMESALDSISANAKRKDMRNWHTRNIQKLISSAVTIWERDLVGAVNKTDPRFTAEHPVHLKHNLMYGYYFLNNFAKARQYYNEIYNYPDFGMFHKIELDDFYKNLDGEELRYEKNKDALKLE